jgi:hypothetical protein
MDDLSVDWSTSQVTPEPDHLKLRVALDGEPDTFWKNAFDQLRQEMPSKSLQAGQDWWVDSPSHKFLSVGGFGEDDDISALRRQLDEVVASANERAKKARLESEEKKRADAEASARLRAAAEDLQKRFRGDPTG